MTSTSVSLSSPETSEEAYEEVYGVLNSSFPNTSFKYVTKALDTKCNEIVKLSALLKNHKADHKSFDGVIFNYFQPLKAALSHQQLKVSVHSLWPLVQQDGSKSFNLANNLTGSPSCLNAKEKAVSEDKDNEVSMHVPPTNIQSNMVNEGKLKVLLSSIQDALPEMLQCNPGSQVIWCQGDEVQVRHQKQTSSQLLCFLKEKAKTKGSLEVTVLECPEGQYKGNHTASPLRTSPTIERKDYQCRHIVTKGLADERAPKTLHANVNRDPIFRVKTVHSRGSLIYSCVIATENELWDVGDIFTEVLIGESLHCTPSERETCLKTFAQVENCIHIELKSRTLQRSQPENNSGHSDSLAPDTVNIHEFEIRKFEETEVVVSHVVSPSNFYIQHADAPEKLKALFTDLKYSHLNAEQSSIPDIGAQVICWLPQNEQWCRAQVSRISGMSKDRSGRESSIKVEVKRLDYGDNSCVSLSNIKQLSPEVAVLPLQALQVSLAHVTPINVRDWTEEAVNWFKEMVHGRTLFARLYPQGPTVTVELFLEKGKLGAMRRGASLSLRLTQNGHAKHNKLKNSGLKKKSAVQIKLRETESEWEKYLISCYSQNKT